MCMTTNSENQEAVNSFLLASKLIAAKNLVGVSLTKLADSDPDLFERLARSMIAIRDTRKNAR